VYMLTHAVSNFTGFAPLGVVLVAMLGVGVAEGSGYIPTLLRRTVQITPRRIITPVVVFLGGLSNVASDAGYVVLIPVGALMFSAYGRHPMAGLAAAFAGVSGGYSANLIIGSTDPLLAGISTEAASMIQPGRIVGPTANWYFMIASTVLITLIGTLVTDRIVEPRLSADPKIGTPERLPAEIPVSERRALRAANLTLLGLVALLIALSLPARSFLRNPETGSLISASPLMNGIIVLIALGFFIPATVYGFWSGTFVSEKEVCAQMGKAMSSMGGYIALAFVSAQFINYFSYTNLGTILAIHGANLLEATGIGGIPLMLLFILFTAFTNLFMGSASAKWTILAPVFIPMFMLLGYSPELTQVAYRIGDSCTNLITPLMSYFAMIVVFAKKYDPASGIGTLISTMLPYSLFF
ncbi:MAG: AbgT family transporter, partial [Oscillospiraceae bacterium]